MRAVWFAALIAVSASVTAQEEAAIGPVILGAGPVFAVADPGMVTPLESAYRLAFEMGRAAPTPEQPNTVLVNVARYLNMHAAAGVPREQVSAAVVVHGAAAWDLLDTEVYRERHGVANPNAGLIAELAAAGVRVILCGQTAGARGIPRGDLLPEVDVALSAMTAFLLLQDEGFRVNPW
jgi:intracellular sulfur oxidation DsrE/DsrF family protein